ncbi:MAG: DNA mismatch repair endonuclease MutL [Planctomycetota bacterium]|jgi:DNA mismatch repair protein MutL
MPIQRLPPLVVNQIAAGEVVERPASVVKELAENAFDAGASRVEIAVEAGGRDLVRVTDDGVAIPFDELALAVAPHATSKIADADDLTAVATLGFRGEALASIGAVSRLEIVSRPAGAPQAGRIEVAGDEIGETRPASGPPGTSVTVRHLFFNTPARRKFLRTDATETSRITELVERLALGHPAIGVRLLVNGRVTVELPPDQTQADRVLEVLGRELEPELLTVAGRDAAVLVAGHAGRPGIARPTPRHQHLFLNGRSIRDRTLVHAVREAYRGLIDPGRHPTIVLFLSLDPADVDVNVHPAKAEVRFRNQSVVHGAVLRAVRAALTSADLVPALDPAAASRDPVLHGLGARPPAEFGAGVRSGVTSSDFIERFRQMDPVQKGFVYSEVREALAADDPEILAGLEPEAAAPARPSQDVEILPEIRPVHEVLQVHASYLVTQDERGLLIIDQHALHERVLFEKLRVSLAGGNLESQRLLMPASIEVEPGQLETLERLRPLLEKIGIEVEPLGPATLGIHAFSSFLFERKVEPEAFLTELLARATSEGFGDDLEAALHEVLDMMACKAAVKAGDRLSASEMAELIKSRERVERSSRCPHGRPTTLRMTIADLDRHFGRR